MTDTQSRVEPGTDLDLDDDGDVDLVELFAPSRVDKLAGARKAIVAAVGVLLQGGAMAGLEGTALQWTQTTLAGLTAAAVYGVRNVRPEPVWLAADEPDASDRTDEDEPIGDSPGEHEQHVPEHSADDPDREHRPEHAAPDEA